MRRSKGSEGDQENGKTLPYYKKGTREREPITKSTIDENWRNNYKNL